MKPKIEKLYDACIRFGVRNATAGFTADKWIESRQLFKKDCEELGIAEMFDWSGLED